MYSILNCPHCGYRGFPHELEGAEVFPFRDDTDSFCYQIFQCTKCNKIYVGIYPDGRTHYNPREIYPYSIQDMDSDINPLIQELSPRFCKIYSEILIAQKEGLDEFVGMGFRKALEFLIKDYAKYLYPENTLSIEKDSLSNVINNQIKNQDIKDYANRGNWLACDYAHYFQEYPQYELADLIDCVKITVEEIRHELRKMELKDIAKVVK